MAELNEAPEWWEKHIPPARFHVILELADGSRHTTLQQLADNLYVCEKTGEIYECVGDNEFKFVSSGDCHGDPA